MPRFVVLPTPTARRHRSAAVLACLLVAVATVAAAQPSIPPRPGAGGYAAEGFIPVPDTALEMYYFVVGEGDPDLVVFSSPFLDGELLPLTERYTVAFVHSRGRGASTAVGDPSSLSYETELADIDAARAFFGLDTMTLAGTSFWGGLAGLYAARYPDRVERLVLLNPIPPRAFWMSKPTELPENDVVAARITLGRLLAAGADDADVYAYCRAELVVLSAETVFDLDRATDRKSDPCQYRNEHSDVAGRLLGALFGSLDGWDWREELAGVTASTLVVHGSHDLVPAEAFEEWGSIVPVATVTRIEEAGHESLLDRPDEVLAALTSFLARAAP